MIARFQGFVKCIVPLLLVAHGITQQPKSTGTVNQIARSVPTVN